MIQIIADFVIWAETYHIPELSGLFLALVSIIYVTVNIQDKVSDIEHRKFLKLFLTRFLKLEEKNNEIMKKIAEILSTWTIRDAKITEIAIAITEAEGLTESAKEGLRSIINNPQAYLPVTEEEDETADWG